MIKPAHALTGPRVLPILRLEPKQQRRCLGDQNKQRTMKKSIVCLSAVALAGLLTGCVGPMGPIAGVGAGIYTDVSGPIAATSNPIGSKRGDATAEGIVCFAKGDASIKAAAENGGITKISHVDYHTQSILGIWAKTTVTVYGE